MLKSRIVAAASSESGIRAAAEWLAPMLGRSEILIVGATRASADEFARSLPGDGSFGLHRFTLVQTAAALAAEDMARRGLAPATRLGMEAVAARVADRLQRGKKLGYFGDVARMPGFPAALASTIEELRLAGVKPGEVRRAEKAGPDLERLLRAYEKELQERRLSDLADLLRSAAAADSHPLLGLPAVFLDAPVDAPLQQAFVERLLRDAPAAFTLVRSGDARALEAWRRLLAVEPEAVESETAAPALDRLRKHMFSIDRPPAGVFDETVEMFAAPGEGLEGVEIARRVHALASKGVRFDEIAVLLRSPDRYQPFLEEAFRRAGIPAYFSRGVARPDPAGRAFLALLHCAAEGCTASRFAEYLSLGEVPPLDDSGAPAEAPPRAAAAEDEMFAAFGAAAAAAPEDEATPRESATVPTPIAWERLLVDAAVIGGNERWKRRLRGLEGEYRLRLQTLEADEQSQRAHFERQIERVVSLERFALPLIDLLTGLRRAAAWREWLPALDQLARRALRDPESVLSVLAELEPMADIGPVELDEVINVLSERLRFLRREPARRRYGAVFVAAIAECRARSFRAVFVPGLAEGLFPQRPFEDPLLLDDVRRAIAEALPTRDDARENERLLLRTAAAAARSRLIVSYPTMDATQGRARVPSFYALEIPRAVEGRVPALKTFETGLRERATVLLSWPAPHDAADAIDAIEYDLAWFTAHRGKAGMASYLLNVNPTLARALRARYARWERKWSDTDGLIAKTAETRALLDDQRLGRRPYSASALQHFAACPYRFYLHSVLQLRLREESVAIEQLDPLTRGALFHAAQFRFVRSIAGGEPESLDAAIGILDRALDDVEQMQRELLAPAIDRVWRTEIEDLRTDLRGWLRYWWQDRAEWAPLHAELAFGLGADSEHDPASRTEAITLPTGEQVRGSIDLVERHRRRAALRITDHKTGKPPERRPTYLGGGAVLQPALYAIAAETLLGAGVECSRLFFCTQRGGYSEIRIELGEATRQRLEMVLGTIDRAVEQGFLPPAPSHGACDNCDFRAVCGPNEERRAANKPKDRLDPLIEVRNMP